MTVEELKKTLSMQDILSMYGIKHKGHKKNISCPFHTDKNPSMQIFKNGYNCHSCGKNGDIFSFVMEYENISFKEAFLRLGGSYAGKEDFSAQQKQKASQFESKKKEQLSILEQKQKLEISDLMEYYSKLSKELEPLSDGWCKCKNFLFQLTYLWEEKYINREDVNVRGVIARYKKSECIRDIIGSDFS